MVYNLWVYVYWFVYKTHFRHTVALAPENVAVKGLKLHVFNYTIITYGYFKYGDGTKTNLLRMKWQFQIYMLCRKY